ncbi:MAG: hypothetical protein V1859_03380 [archaeon]
MESLMVYGIAILIVMLAVGALIYFGVLDLGSYLPDKCQITGAALECESFSIARLGGSQASVRMEVRNTMGKNIDILSITKCIETEENDKTNLITTGSCANQAFFNEPSGGDLNTVGGSNLLNGQTGFVDNFACTIKNTVKAGSKVKLSCTLSYQLVGSGLPRTANVNVQTAVLQ